VWIGTVGLALRALTAALLLSVGIAGTTWAAEEPGRLDINTATAAELETLPGIGPAKAQAIVAHREEAPFKNADELIEVKGIGERLYAQIKNRVTVSGAAAVRKAGTDPAAGDAKAGRAANAASRP
jgi:competence ComEA-like helix-hairpin-helix protein